MRTILGCAIVAVLTGGPAARVASSQSALPESCPTHSIGGDTTLVNGYAGVIFGEALGEVFVATDTLIHSITVWRWARLDTDFVAIKLYVTETDTDGRPLATAIVQNGPALVVPYGDGVHGTPFEFVFDPPLALPHRGRFCAAVQAAPCDASMRFDASSLDPYPDGAVWRFGRSTCYLRPFPQQYPTVDLMFRIKFCDATTPIQKPTWGSVKSIYRR